MVAVFYRTCCCTSKRASRYPDSVTLGSTISVKTPGSRVLEPMKSGQANRTLPRYFTTGRKTNPKTLSELEQSRETQFRTPADISTRDIETFKEEQRLERRRNRKGGYANHQNYSSRLRLNLPERLLVPDIILLPGKSITDDIDRDFYTLVAGRRIKVNERIREYLKDVRNCFLTKLKIGYYADEILQAEEVHSWEKEKYGMTKRKFEVYRNCFEDFLDKDHSSSLELLRAAESEKKISEEKKAKIADLSDRARKLEAELLVLEEKWSTYRTYQKFFYNMSPAEWRKEHDNDFHPEGSRPSNEDDIQSRLSEEGRDLSEKIRKFVEESSRSRPPALYFERPDQVLRIFHELETNNLIALTYCENLELPIQRMMSELKKVKSEVGKNQRMLEEEISLMRASVEEEERRAKSLQDKCREVVFGMCKDFIVSEEIIIVTALIEDAYEDAIARNDYDLSMVTMMKEIEGKYETLLLTLDRHPYHVLVPTIKGFYRDQKRAEKEAEEAEKKVHQMEILLKRLSKSLTYPKKGPHRTIPRKLVHRSEPVKEELKRYDQIRVISKEEKEVEYFFGKTCRNIGEAGFYRPLCSMSKTIFPAIPD